MANNITFKNNNPWRSSVGSLYEQDIFDWILLHPEQYQTINDFQRNHWDIYTRNTDNGLIRSKINTDEKTKQYQKAINDTFDVVNTKGISGGISSGRYNAVSKPNSGDRATVWTPEGLYGAYTDDRRVLGRIGDYTTADLEEFAERLEPVGLEVYLDPQTNYYMLRPIGLSARNLSSRVGGEPTNRTGNNGSPGDNQDTPVQYPKPINWLGLSKNIKSNYPGWSDWIPLSAKKIVDDLAAIRTGNLERKKVFPKEEAPYEWAKVTDAYAQRLLLEKQKQEVLARAGFNPTSDLAKNVDARVKGEEIALQISDKLTALKSLEFAETSKLVQEVANRNRLYAVNTANQNAKVNAATMNNIIDSRIKQNERLASNLGTYIGDMYVNFGEYLKTKRLNENAKKKQAALSEYNLNITSAYKPYYDLVENPTSWGKINDFVREFDAEGAPGLTDDLIRVWNYRDFKNPEYTNLIVNLLKNSSSTAAKKYRALYLQELSNIEKQSEYYGNIAQAKLNNILAAIDTYATNQWGWNPQSRVHKSVLSSKSGGKLTDDFSKLERIRLREQLSVRDNTTRRHKLASDNLNKQLDRISREELTLLRAIFK